MKFLYSNDIWVKNPTQSLLDWCKENLVLDNPAFYKLERLGKWTGGTPRQIVLYEKNGDDLRLPFGCLRNLSNMFPQCERWADFVPFRRTDYESNINLYDYQENAVRAAFRAGNGVLVMPCGSGKTQCGLELVARLGGKALWLTHTQDLLNQSMNRAKEVLGVSSKTIGTITGGKVNIGSGITFATVQTMSSLDLAKYKYEWDVIIVDECHRCIGSPSKVMQFYKVVSSLACRYKYGLTATPKRSDGFERSMFVLLGDIVCEIGRDEVKHTTCPVRVEFRETNYSPDLSVVLMGDGTINYASLMEDMIGNQDRYDTVFDAIKKAGARTLVLAGRVNYLAKLNDDFVKSGGKSVCISTIGTSKKAKEERKEAYRKLDSGELDAIFATYAIAKEGLDVPSLRTVIFATPEKGEITVTQAAGRVARKAEGKEYGTIIDFVDNFGLLLGWSKARARYYKKLQYDVL